MENYQSQKTSKLGLVGKIILGSIGILGALGLAGCLQRYNDPITGWCWKEQLVPNTSSVGLYLSRNCDGNWQLGGFGSIKDIENLTKSIKQNEEMIAHQNACRDVNCDDTNCYSSIDKSFCLTRKDLIANWTKQFKQAYKNNPNYFITTTLEKDQLPEVKENFKIFKTYAVAELGVAKCDSNDCFYNDEKLCSRNDFEDVASNIYTERFLKGKTEDIEKWYTQWIGFPKVQERIRLLEAEWVKAQQFAQLKNSQNNNYKPQQQVIVQPQPQQPDVGTQVFMSLFRGLGTDLMGYEYIKRNP